jgi:hypothetical protein
MKYSRCKKYWYSSIGRMNAASNPKLCATRDKALEIAKKLD